MLSIDPHRPVLRAERLRKNFRGTVDARPALDDVSLSLAPGDFAIVIGGNGAGKSTLLNAIAGETTLDGGRIAIDGRDVTSVPTRKRAAWIARVFQDPSAGTAGAMSVAENLSLAERRGCRNGLKPALNSTKLARFLELLSVFGLGLEDRLDQAVRSLSGGQRQSLAVAMAIMKTPRLLLLDEHTAALDPRAAEVVMRETVNAIEREQLTALMVTHNMQHAIDYGSRLVMMIDGRITYQACGEEKDGLTRETLIDRFHAIDGTMVG